MGWFAPGPPGDGPLTSGIARVFDAVGRACPPEWRSSGESFFANYWAMSVDDFRQYMEWSYPLCAWALAHFDTDDFLRGRGGGGNEPFVGELLERAVQIWQLSTGRRVRHIGALDLSGFAHPPKGHADVGPDIAVPSIRARGAGGLDG